MAPIARPLADEPIKIGLDNPLTGTFAALGKKGADGAHLVRLCGDLVVLAAEKAKSLEPLKLAKAMQGLVLPPEVAC